MNEIKIFSNESLGQVRTVITASGEPLFCLADVCGVIGLSNPTAVASRLDDDLKAKLDLGLRNGQQATFVTESGLYDVVIRSDSERAKPFRKWVTSEVLPSIRKHGAYMTLETIEQVIRNPDNMIRLLTALKTEQKQNVSLRMQNVANTQAIEAMKPKAEYCDKVLQSKSLIATDSIAAELGISARKLNKFLCDSKVQYKVNGVYVLYSDMRGKGLEGYKTFHFTNPNTDEPRTEKHMYWTETGEYFIMKLYKSGTSKLLN